jgi:biopolymer transport protein ExbD
MKYMLVVCLVCLGLVATTFGQTPALQRGVSVQEARTNHATAMPGADQDDAWVIAVTADGKFYFGAEELTVTSFWDTMKKLPHRRDAGWYVKADARASFAAVEQVLELGRAAFETVGLLTSQAQRVQAGSMAPPMGLEVELNPQAGAAVVQVHSGPSGSTVKVDGQDVSWAELPGVLAGKSGKPAVIKADGQALFGDIARVVDVSAAAGVKAAVDGMEL